MPTAEELQEWRRVSAQGVPEQEEAPTGEGVRPGDKGEPGWHPDDSGLPSYVSPEPEGDIAGPEEPAPEETPDSQDIENSGNVQNNPAP